MYKVIVFMLSLQSSHINVPDNIYIEDVGYINPRYIEEQKYILKQYKRKTSFGDFFRSEQKKIFRKIYDYLSSKDTKTEEKIKEARDVIRKHEPNPAFEDFADFFSLFTKADDKNITEQLKKTKFIECETGERSKDAIDNIYKDPPRAENILDEKMFFISDTEKDQPEVFNLYKYLDESRLNMIYPYTVTEETKGDTKLGWWLFKELESPIATDYMKNVIRNLRFNEHIPEEDVKRTKYYLNTVFTAKYSKKAVKSFTKKAERKKFKIKQDQRLSYKDIINNYIKMGIESPCQVTYIGNECLKEWGSILVELAPSETRNNILNIYAIILNMCLTSPNIPFDLEADLAHADRFDLENIFDYEHHRSFDYLCTHVLVNGKKSIYVLLPIQYRFSMGMKLFVNFLEHFRVNYGRLF